MLSHYCVCSFIQHCKYMYVSLARETILRLVSEVKKHEKGVTQISEMQQVSITLDGLKSELP